MNKEVVVRIHNGIQLNYNRFESVLMRWMKPEVSQKEKYLYSILTHIYGLKKDSNDNPICKAAQEMDIKNRLFTLWE